MEAAPTHRRAILYLVLTAFLWSSSGLLIKTLDWHPLAIMCGRSSIAAVVFLVYLRKVRIRPSKWQAGAILGSITTQIMFVSSTKLTTAANAIFLQYTAPVFIVLLAYWWLGERPKRIDWAVLAVILPGMALFFSDQLTLEGTTGNIMALISGASLALMTVCMRKLRGTDPAVTMLLVHILCALIGFPWLVRESFTPANLAMIGYLGVFQIGISYILYSYAIQHVEALESTLILTLEPILNPIWVALILKEVPGIFALAGGALVVGAVTVRALVSTKSKRSVIAEVKVTPGIAGAPQQLSAEIPAED